MASGTGRMEMCIRDSGWVVTLGYYLWYYFSGRVTLKIRMKEMLPTKEISVRMYQVGIPATLNMALPSLLISALNGMLAVYSQIDVYKRQAL